MPSTEYQNDRFIRAKDIRQRYGISDATLHRWTRLGKIPKPEFLNQQRVWRESVLIAAEAAMLSSGDRTPNRLGA